MTNVDVELNVGSGKKCSNCGGTVAAGRKTCHNCGESFGALEDRILALELAVTALGRAEFGDVPGHDFHGNQHTGGIGDTPKTNDGTRPRPIGVLPGKGRQTERGGGKKAPREVRVRYSDGSVKYVEQYSLDHEKAMANQNYADRIYDAGQTASDAVHNRETATDSKILDWTSQGGYDRDKPLPDRVVNDLMKDGGYSRAEIDHAWNLEREAETARRDAELGAHKALADELRSIGTRDLAPKRGDLVVHEDGLIVRVESSQAWPEAGKGARIVSGPGQDGSYGGVYDDGNRWGPNDGSVTVPAAKAAEIGFDPKSIK